MSLKMRKKSKTKCVTQSKSNYHIEIIKSYTKSINNLKSNEFFIKTLQDDFLFEILNLLAENDQ